eukprot:g8737.t1
MDWSKGKGKGDGMEDLMSWALTMASMYGPPPGWEGKGDAKWGSFGSDKGKGKSKGSSSMASTNNASCKVFVGALPKVVSEPQVRSAFEHFGHILEVFANYDYNMVDGKWVDCKPASQGASAGGAGGGGGWGDGSKGKGDGKASMMAMMMAMSGAAGAGGTRPGDWVCGSCGDYVFSSRDKCNRCGAPKPSSAKRMGMKPGDWTCPSCGDLVFASKNACSLCGTPKPAELRSSPY